MNHTTPLLLYDDECPLCSWYSHQFVRFGFLPASSRVAFSTAGAGILSRIDTIRGRDEIPWFDPATGQTRYGIDALLAILGTRCRSIESTGRIRPVYWLLEKLYRLISMNRKVIVARRCGQGRFDCSPGFDPFYRILFLVIFLLFNSIMLVPIHAHLLSQLPHFQVNVRHLQLSHLLFVGINCGLAFSLGRERGLEYLGQINMLALIAILALTVLMAVHQLLSLPGLVLLGSLAGLLVFEALAYFRRMRYAGILPDHRIIAIINICCLAGFLAYLFH